MKLKTATCILTASLTGFALQANSIGVQADARGTLWYPNQGPDSVGNETQESFANSSGVLSGDTHAGAVVNTTRSGTDASAGPGKIGTSGSTSVRVTADATLGHLGAQGTASAESHSNGGSSVFFPHGAAAVNALALPVARFDDVTTVFNAGHALGEAIPVNLTLFLNWHGGFDLGTAGFNFGQSGATATLAVDWVGNVSAFDLMRSDVAPANWSFFSPQTISFTIPNGSSFGWWSSLSIFAGVSLGGVYSDSQFHFPDVSASAFSSATIDITPNSSYAGTTFTSASGHVYSEAASHSLPDSASTLGLLGLGVSVLGYARRRLRHS